MLLSIRNFIFSYFYIFIFMNPSAGFANADGDYFKKEDLDFAREVTTSAKPYGMDALREKYKEFEQMQKMRVIKSHNNGTLTSANPDIGDEEGFAGDGVSLKVFVSTSMNKSLLKNYARAAKKYRATLVFNGLPEGSFRNLSDLVFDITESEEEAFSMQIDDTAFEEYKISSVPAFILVKEKSIFDEEAAEDSRENNPNSTFVVYDKISGNIGIKRALEIFSEEGELSLYANKIIENQRGEND